MSDSVRPHRLAAGRHCHSGEDRPLGFSSGCPCPTQPLRPSDSLLLLSSKFLAINRDEQGKDLAARGKKGEKTRFRRKDAKNRGQAVAGSQSRNQEARRLTLLARSGEASRGLGAFSGGRWPPDSVNAERGGGDRGPSPSVEMFCSMALCPAISGHSILFRSLHTELPG